MGLRFRKSVKIAPGVRLNFNKKSTSVSVGGKGATYTVNSTGKKTASVGIPGTGLYYTESVGGKKKGTVKGSMNKKQKAPKTTRCKSCGNTIPASSKFCPDCGAKIKKPFFKKWWFWLILILALVAGGGSESTDKADDTTQHVQTSIAGQRDDAVAEQVESTVTTEPEEVGEPENPAPETEEVTEVTSEETTEVTEVTEETSEETSEETTTPTEESKPVTEEVVESPVETPIVTEPEPVPEPQPQKQAGTDYVLNTNRMKFHYTWCSSVKQMSEKNKAFYTGTRDEVIARGYDPCGNCHP